MNDNMAGIPLCGCGLLHTKLYDNIPNQQVCICPGEGQAHWVGPCCKNTGKYGCQRHPRERLLTAVNMFNCITTNVTSSSIGGIKPTSITWETYRQLSLKEPLVKLKSYHPLTLLGVGNTSSIIESLLGKICFTDSILSTISKLQGYSSVVQLSPFFVAKVDCQLETCTVQLFIYAPYTDTCTQMCVSISYGTEEVFATQFLVSTGTKIDTPFTFPLMPADHLSRVDDNTQFILKIWLKNGRTQTRSD